MTIIKGRNRAEYVSGTILVIIICMFFFSVIDKLNFGVYAICLAIFLLYIISIPIAMRQKRWKNLFKEFFQPYIIWILIVYIILLIENYGRLVVVFDDLDHWALSVKELWRLGGFSNETVDYAPSYPPAMALLQYFVIKTRANMLQVDDFSEWWLFVTYQFATYSMLMPMLAYFKKKRLSKYICGVMLFFIPSFLFPTFKNKLYIDTFLSILAAYGMLVLLKKEMDSRTKFILVSLVCAVLTLTKDVGFIFAIGIALTYFLVTVLDNYAENVKQNILKKIYISVAILIPFLARWSWSKKFSSLGFYSSASSVSEMMKTFKVTNIIRDILGLEVNYHNETFVNYVTAFFNQNVVKIGNTNISISFFVCFALLTFVLYLMLLYMPKEEKRYYCTIGIGCIITLWLYIIAQGIFYMYSFTRELAVGLTAYSRYMGIAYQAYFIEVIALICIWINKKQNLQYNRVIIVLLSIICCIPLDSFFTFLNRDSVNDSIRKRVENEIYEKEIREVIDSDELLYIVNLKEDATAARYQWHSINFLCNDIKKEINPAGDIKQTSAEEWLDYLIHNYNYVYLIEINDEFVATYGSIFEKEPDIENRSMYRVDKENRKLCVADDEI